MPRSSVPSGRTPAGAVLVIALLCAWAGATPAAAQIAFEPSRAGALAAVPDGLRHNGEPPVQLAEPFGEWFGVAFDDPRGRIDAVGAGALPDWAARAPVAVKAFHRSDDAATSVTMAGNLEIRTEFYSPPGSRALLVSVILKNKGFEPLRNIVYTREWMLAGADGRTVLPSGAEVEPELAKAWGLRDAPPNLMRQAWRPKDLTWKQSAGKVFVFAESGIGVDGTLPDPDVLLALWTSPAYPDGLPVGATNGVTFHDYDGDGWIDIFAAESANLWRNLGGADWELAANLEGVLPDALIRYGSSFADYDNDGDTDIATEPRNVGLGLDRCMHLLRNLGGATFVDVATDPLVMDVQPCLADSETICWGDVDADGDLDLFLPVYPAWAEFSGPGNFFLRNLGPIAGGHHGFAESSAAAGLDNPAGTSRPEGAQMCDYDGDGDIDLFSNGTLYRNVSSLLAIDFEDLTDTAGIGLRDELDEGVLFTDYDMDGDFDLVVSYLDSAAGNRIWENRGDGHVFLTDPEIIVNWFLGVGLGLSCADWDNDGDVDLTTRQVFRKNLLVETGERSFIQAIHFVDFDHLTSATPAWGDWDLDGDLDTVIGNWIDEGHFYDNELYGGATPAADKRHVRVRVVRDSDQAPEGLETEYGAAVEIHVAGEEEAGRRRRQHLASGHGYLNQNEYALHFALPEDPAPGDPEEDVRFDVSVDFPGLPEQGLWRVDKHVNTALGNIDLADLADREITVYRSGKVVVDGVTTPTAPNQWPRLETTNGGAALPSPGAPLPALAPAPNATWWAGIELDGSAMTGPVRVREILLDGQLGAPTGCSEPFNIVMWDVTGPGAPQMVTGSDIVRVTDPRNDRTAFRTDLRLKPGRVYRLVARLAMLRTTALVEAGGGPDEPILTGGLSFNDPTPCSGGDVAAAALDTARVPFAVRYSTTAPDPWQDLGNGLAGVSGVPQLDGSGWLAASAPITISLSNARPLALVNLIVGFTTIEAPFKGGVLVPAPVLVIGGLPTSGAGALVLPALWPPGIPSGFPLFMQYWLPDPAGVQGWAASNALGAVTP